MSGGHACGMAVDPDNWDKRCGEPAHRFVTVVFGGEVFVYWLCDEHFDAISDAGIVYHEGETPYKVQF